MISHSNIDVVAGCDVYFSTVLVVVVMTYVTST